MVKRIIICAGVFILFAVLLSSRVVPTGIQYNTTDSGYKINEDYRMCDAPGQRAMLLYRLNSDPAAKLRSCPYIGGYADEIVALRGQLGGFTSLEQLALIQSIGPGLCEKAAGYCCLD